MLYRYYSPGLDADLVLELLSSFNGSYAHCSVKKVIFNNSPARIEPGDRLDFPHRYMQEISDPNCLLKEIL